MLVALTFAVAIESAAVSETATGALMGSVLNATCPGPCRIPPPLPLYEGDNLSVVIRALPERLLIARLHPKDGTFEIELPPGLYRVRAVVGQPKLDTCWEGSLRKVLIESGATRKVRLKVRNVCVL